MDFRDIEDQIVAKLKALAYFNTVESYSDNFARDISLMPANLPAVYIILSSGGFTQVDVHMYNCNALWSLFVVNHNYRSEAINREGAYDDIIRITNALAYKDLGLADQKVYPILKSVRLAKEPRTALLSYVMEFETSIDTVVT